MQQFYPCIQPSADCIAFDETTLSASLLSPFPLTLPTGSGSNLHSTRPPSPFPLTLTYSHWLRQPSPHPTAVPLPTHPSHWLRQPPPHPTAVPLLPTKPSHWLRQPSPHPTAAPLPTKPSHWLRQQPPQHPPSAPLPTGSIHTHPLSPFPLILPTGLHPHPPSAPLPTGSIHTRPLSPFPLILPTGLHPHPPSAPLPTYPSHWLRQPPPHPTAARPLPTHPSHWLRQPPPQHPTAVPLLPPTRQETIRYDSVKDFICFRKINRELRLQSAIFNPYRTIRFAHMYQRGTVPYRTWSHWHYTRTSISGPRRERIREVSLGRIIYYLLYFRNLLKKFEKN